MYECKDNVFFRQYEKKQILFLLNAQIKGVFKNKLGVKMSDVVPLSFCPLNEIQEFLVLHFKKA